MPEIIKPLHANALQLYDRMLEEADDDNLFTGSITATFRNLGISNGNYTIVTRLLNGIGAITCLQRGARSLPSIYRIGKRPTPEELSSVTLTSKPRADTVLLEQRLADMEKRIGRLDIVLALANIETRVGDLEAKQGENK